MIFSSLYANNRSIVFPSAIEEALEYLKSHDFTTMEPGVYEIKGKDIYAQVFDTETKPAEKQRPEVHEKYIDVQFLASGKEKLGFTPDTGNYEVAERDDERDLIFYKEVENEGFVEARPGCFQYLLPGRCPPPCLRIGRLDDRSKSSRKSQRGLTVREAEVS